MMWARAGLRAAHLGRAHSAAAVAAGAARGLAHKRFGEAQGKKLPPQEEEGVLGLSLRYGAGGEVRSHILTKEEREVFPTWLSATRNLLQDPPRAHVLSDCHGRCLWRGWSRAALQVELGGFTSTTKSCGWVPRRCGGTRP